MAELVTIYTDGACRGNPGKGGWGVLLSFKGTEKELYGAEPDTTNNRMELTGAIQALEALTKPCAIELYIDSSYVLKGITEWLPNWQKRGWRTASNQPVKNQDLWQRLATVIEHHQIEWKWVKGHSGNPGNDRADALANRAIDELT